MSEIYENTLLTVEEITALAKYQCPKYASKFEITINKQDNTIVLVTEGYKHTETITELCEAEVNGSKIPKRPAMELNLCCLFENMKDICRMKKLNKVGDAVNI